MAEIADFGLAKDLQHEAEISAFLQRHGLLHVTGVGDEQVVDISC